METTNTNILSLKNVKAGYHNKLVIQNISINVKRGDIISILGANGSGKSTLFKALMNVIELVDGEILFEGKNITQMASYLINQLGISYLLQDNAIFTSLTVRENLVLSRKMNVNRNYQIEELIEFFPILNKLYHKRSGLLSGGERQILAIAMVLIQKPKLALLDEPSSGLSSNLVTHIMEIIRSFNAKYGTTFLIIEQNIKAVSEIVNSTYILKNGELYQDYNFLSSLLTDKLETVFFSQ